MLVLLPIKYVMKTYFVLIFLDKHSQLAKQFHNSTTRYIQGASAAHNSTTRYIQGASAVHNSTTRYIQGASAAHNSTTRYIEGASAIFRVLRCFYKETSAKKSNGDFPDI